MSDKERRVSDRSLENLKLGAQARYKGKVRQNFTILPETLEWLKKAGNASERIDLLVAAAKTGMVDSNNTHDKNNEQKAVSDSVYNQIEALKAEIEQLRAHLTGLQEQLESCQAERSTLSNSAEQWQQVAERNQELLASRPVAPPEAIALLRNAVTSKKDGGSYAANNATGLKKLVEQALMVLERD